MLSIEEKLLIQELRKRKKYENIMEGKGVKVTQEFLDWVKELDEPLLYRVLSENFNKDAVKEDRLTGNKQSINLKKYNLNYQNLKVLKIPLPPISDSLVNVTLQSLVDEFVKFLEKEKKQVVEQGPSFLVIYELSDGSNTSSINESDLFKEFIESCFPSEIIEKRWNLIKDIYNLKDTRSTPSPEKLYKHLLERKYKLSVTTESGDLGDDSKNYCIFCGRKDPYYKVVSGFATHSSQRPQSKLITKNPQMCGVCLFSIMVSPVRTVMGTGTFTTPLVALRNTGGISYSHIFNRLLGISTGRTITLQRYYSIRDDFGETVVKYLALSQLPAHIIQDQGFSVNYGGTIIRYGDKKKVMMIKAFENLIGSNGVFSHRSGSDKKITGKAFQSVIKNRPFELLVHLAGLRHFRDWQRELDIGIFKMIKYGVIKMKEDRPDIIFGMALLLDAFLPKKSEDNDAKTEVRKIAYYLDKPEDVVFRLSQIKGGKDYGIIKRNERNKAQYKLLVELMEKVFADGKYGDFWVEQKGRKENFDVSKEKDEMVLRFDDVIKVYLYIDDYMKSKYQERLKDLKRAKENLLSRVKYALVARRPELNERSGD